MILRYDLRWDWCIWQSFTYLFVGICHHCTYSSGHGSLPRCHIDTTALTVYKQVFIFLSRSLMNEYVYVICNERGLYIKEGLFLYCWLLCFRGRLPNCCPVFRLGDHLLFINQFFAPTWQDPSWHFIDKKLNRVH